MNEQDILKSVGRDGWTITGRSLQTKTVVDPTDPLGTRKIEKPTGNTIWSISGPNGQSDQMVVGTVLDPTSQARGGIGYQVVEPPSKTPTAPTAVAGAPDRQFNPDGTPNKNYVPPATKPAPTPTDQLDPVTDPTTGKTVGLRDPSTGTVISLPEKTGDDGSKVVTVGRRLVKVAADGSVSTLAEVPKDASQKTPVKVGDTTYVFDPDTGQFTPGLTDPAAAQTQNKPDVVATNTTAPFLMTLTPDGQGHWGWQKEPNPNQLTVSDSVLRLYSQLAPLTGSGQGQIPVETATSLLTSAYQAMSAQTAAATQQEGVRHDQASEADNAATRAETGRHNQATEQAAQDTLDTTERGQTLDYASKASEAASTATSALAKDYLPPEAGAYGLQLLGGNTNAPVPTSFTANPYDPLAAARSAAAEVLAHISPSARSHLAATTGQFPGAGGGAAPTTAPPSSGYIPAPNTGGWYGAGRPSAQTPGSAPTTTIAPDGTITVQHTSAPSASNFPTPGAGTGGQAPAPPNANAYPTTDANGLRPDERQN